MTANQINYLKYLEDVRSHRASESNAARQAAASEAQAYASGLSAGAAQASASAAQASAYANQIRAQADAALAEQNILASQAHIDYEQTMARLQGVRVQNEVTNAAKTLTETTRHNQQTEANQLLVAGIQSDTSKYVADASASASKYATDVKASTDVATTQSRNATTERGQNISALTSLIGTFVNAYTNSSKSKKG